MKTNFIFIIFLLLLHDVGAQNSNIINLINKEGQVNIYNNENYIFSLSINSGNLYISFESSGIVPSIVAYKYNDNDNELLLITKNRWVGSESSQVNEELRSTYYRVALSTYGNVIRQTTSKLDKIDFTGLHIELGKLNDSSINIRKSDSVTSDIMGIFNINELVEIENFNNGYVKINSMNDYWYKIKTKKKTGWIYGYFVDFSQLLSISAIEKNQ